MEIVTKTLDCLTANAEMVAKKIREVVLNNDGRRYRVNFSLNTQHPSAVFVRLLTTGSVNIKYIHERELIRELIISEIGQRTGNETVDIIKEFLRDVDKTIRLKADFEQKCYEAYQLDWMIAHGHSLDELYKLWLSYEQDMFDPDDFNESPFDESDLERSMIQARDMFLYQYGFGEGQVYASKEKFLTHEFMDSDYMEHLLTLMPNTMANRVYYYCEYKSGEVIS